GDLKERMQSGALNRSKSKDAVSNGMVTRPHQFREMNRGKEQTLAIPVVSSENRDYLPVDLLAGQAILSNKCFALFDSPLWNMALIASRLHWVWIGTVCVRLEMRFSYSNTLGWNTFPIPLLTEKNKKDLTSCAEEILIARERHFPATISDLYDPENMPADLLQAHERNDEVLERIYIGRRFKNDTERLEKLFDLYIYLTSKR
ncbi:MAG: lactate dehydrogenase, partial [Sphingobacteriales bacterium]